MFAVFTKDYRRNFSNHSGRFRKVAATLRVFMWFLNMIFGWQYRLNFQKHSRYYRMVIKLYFVYNKDTYAFSMALYVARSSLLESSQNIRNRPGSFRSICGFKRVLQAT